MSCHVFQAPPPHLLHWLVYINLLNMFFWKGLFHRRFSLCSAWSGSKMSSQMATKPKFTGRGRIGCAHCLSHPSFPSQPIPYFYPRRSRQIMERKVLFFFMLLLFVLEGLVSIHPRTIFWGASIENFFSRPKPGKSFLQNGCIRAQKWGFY